MNPDSQSYDGFDAVDRFLQGNYFDVNSLTIPKWELSQQIDTANLTQRILQRRNTILELVPASRIRIERIKTIYPQMFECEQAVALGYAGLKYYKSRFTVGVTSGTEAMSLKKKLLAEYQYLQRELNAFKKLSGVRLIENLELAQFQNIATPIGITPALMEHIKQLLEALKVLQQANMERAKLDFEATSLAALENYARNLVDTVSLAREIERKIVIRVGQRINKIMQITSAVFYPFRHAEGEISIGRYLTQTKLDPNIPGAMLKAAYELLQNFDRMAIRIYGYLVPIAEKVEQVFGFSPFPAVIRRAEIL